MDADAVLPMAGVIFEPTSAPPVLPQGPRPQPLRARLSRIRISPDEPPPTQNPGLAPAQSSLATSTLWHVPVGQCCVDRL